MKNIKLFFKMYQLAGLWSAIVFFLPGKKMKVPIKGIKRPVIIRKVFEDLEVLYQVFKAGEYPVGEFGNPKTIIDGGAHIGTFSILMANHFPDAKIVAVEPVFENAQILLENAKWYDNIIFLPNAIGAHDGEFVTMQESGRGGNWSFYSLPSHIEEKDSIPTVSINAIMSRYLKGNIDVLKLDVEGAEKDIFSRPFECGWLTSANVVVFEPHDDIQLRSFSNVMDCLFCWWGHNFEFKISGENIIAKK